jgi:lipopolysaccharide/colanic/teichoic acid biosynthesis glycosyltransferase
MIMRLFDVVLSLIGMLFLLLMLPFVAFLIKLDSSGPIFYLCNRVGRDGKIFKMFKFRTMYETKVQLGVSVSAHGDPRVTRVGRVLRRLKLNEFPQFINVLKGEMAIVGPRPESPDLAAAYPPGAEKIFSVKPGLVGPNQILGRNEEEWYPPGVDHKKYYIEYILPKKLPLDLQYVEDKSFFKDIKYFFLGVKATFMGVICRRHLVDNRRQILMFLTDLSLVVLSFLIANLLRYEHFWAGKEYQVFIEILPWVVALRLLVFIYFGFYHTMVRHLTIFDIKKVFAGVGLSNLVLVGFAFLSGLSGTGYSRGVFVIDWFCLTTLIIGYRVMLKKIYLRRRSKSEPPTNIKKPVLIWGAGDAGELCLRYLLKEPNPAYKVVGYIDDDSQKRGKKIRGIPVLGDRHNLDILIQLNNIKEIIVAIYAANSTELEEIYSFCRRFGVKTRWFMLDAKVVCEADYTPAVNHKTMLEPVSAFGNIAAMEKPL